MIELSAAADKLLEELKAEGIKLSLTGERLRVQGELSDEFKERVRYFADRMDVSIRSIIAPHEDQVGVMLN